MAKYAQPCVEGVYMGIVNVHLGNTSHNGVRICGDGRMHQTPITPISGVREAWLDGKPKVCKFHKLFVKDRPDHPPERLEVELEFFLYKDRRNEHYSDGNTGPGYDESMQKEISYDSVTCIIELLHPKSIDAESGGYFQEYSFGRLSVSTDDRDSTNIGILTSLARKNKYTFEFQILNAHPSFPGLFFASSVGYPSDRLAVLFGGRALKRVNDKIHAGTRVEPEDRTSKFFAQYKFDNRKWYTLKIIHAAMANMLSKIEYMYNDLLPSAGLDLTTIVSTQLFCQQVLDYITEPYIDTVLENMEMLMPREGMQVKISQIREVCEYVFLMKYPFLITSRWKRNAGIYTLSDSFQIDVTCESNIGNIRPIVYKVVSSIIEPNEAPGAAADENKITEVKINAFSAYDVFRAYTDCRYRYDEECPQEFTEVLEDAKQLALNVKYLKTSSNFALVRLMKSCARAVDCDSRFKLISESMLYTSKGIISLLLQRSPETLHEKFLDYVLSTAKALRNNELSSRTNIHNIDDSDIESFNFTDTIINMDDTDKLHYLVFATQLHVLVGMRRSERSRAIEAERFLYKNYFKINTL